MSADLFAEFDDFSQPQQPQQPPRQVPTPFAPTSELPDPFAFSTAAPIISGAQKTQPWPSFQDTTSADPWGDFGSTNLGGVASKPAGDDDDDGWGDFETAQTAPKATTQTKLQQAPVTTRNDTSTLPRQNSQKRPPQRTRVLRAPTLELMTNSLIDIPGANVMPEDARSPPWLRKSFSRLTKDIPKAAAQPSFPKAAVVNPNVLFDADDFEGQNIKEEEEDDDDEFGDFETVAPAAEAPKDILSDDFFTTPITAKRTSAELLSTLSLHDPKSQYPQAPKSPSFQDRNPFPGLALNTPEKSEAFEDANREPSPDTAWPSLDQQDSGASKSLGDDWGAFGSFPGEPTPNKRDISKEDDWDWDSFDTQKTSAVKPAASNNVSKGSDASLAWDAGQATSTILSQSDEGRAPPVNVPPPSVLLSIFPEILGQANESLYKPIGGQPFSIKNRILSDPKTIDFLRGYLLLATIAARVIAGRKLRWHRDKFLSQGMSISMAGSKGMKLAGVDKTQSVREDREAVDVLDIWKEHVGRLRSSVASANTVIKNPSEHLKIPDLRENMQAQTAKGVPTAPKACVICGLKRDERIARVDFEVEDSFGEWWTEHWGHTTCRRFWLQHENALRTRQ
jgi:hypothetical protein